tara:strand:- start:56 stop:391 length:336 start_codon:yes stop_codon:yes gene_type:complete
MAKATGTEKTLQNLTIIDLKKQIDETNKWVREVEEKIDAIPKKYTVEQFQDRLKFFETRFEWWQESKETERILYNHLKNPVYELMDMVKLIKNYLTRETGFNASKEREKKK